MNLAFAAISGICAELHHFQKHVKKCRNIYEYRQVRKYNDPYIEHALTKHPSTYKAIMNVVENVEDKLNKQENI